MSGRTEQAVLDTHQRALEINLDPTIFGSFAEIGAGQEVARWFLRVGAASGTVGKTVSAYDKEVSDDLYGTGSRYVSRERLATMLDCEWEQLLVQVGPSRGGTTRLFSFTDTVAARNFAGTNECHGWIGVRFQERPGGEPSGIVLHVNMMQPSNLRQQEALGVLGVNLIYAAFYERGTLDAFLDCLAGNLTEGRLEIDLIDTSGPAFASWDQPSMLVELVRHGLAEAVIFCTDGVSRPPTEIIHNKAVVLEPGLFEHVVPIHQALLAGGIDALRDEQDADGAEPVGLFCLAATPRRDSDPAPTAAALLERVCSLLEQGSSVLLARRRELYHVTALVNRFTQAPIRFVVGVATLIQLFGETHYQHLEGRMLEGVSRLFASNVRFYAFPMPAASMSDQFAGLEAGGWKVSDRDDWVTADKLCPPPPLGHLYHYLLASDFLRSMPELPGG